MSHERKAIRNAVVAALTGATDAGANVFKTRLAPMRVADLPAINVYVDSERRVEDDAELSEPRKLARICTLAIEAWARVDDDVDDTLEDLAFQIETAMDADRWFGTEVENSVYSSSEFAYQINGDKPMGCVHIEYDMTYRTADRITNPTDIFDTAATSFDLAGAQAAADEASDLVENINQE